jgi:hypothetical protein
LHLKTFKIVFDIYELRIRRYLVCLHHICSAHSYLRHANKRQPLLIDYLFLMCAFGFCLRSSLCGENIFVCLFPKHHSLFSSRRAHNKWLKNLIFFCGVKTRITAIYLTCGAIWAFHDVSFNFKILFYNLIGWWLLFARKKKLLRAFSWETLFWQFHPHTIECCTMIINLRPSQHTQKRATRTKEREQVIYDNWDAMLMMTVGEF